MVRHTLHGVQYAPLYVHCFQLLQPHTLLEAEKFNIRYKYPSQITTTADKLRWYRYKKALLQRDVAQYAGISRGTYASYEEDNQDYYPLNILEKIAELLEVPIMELLDEYNTFLYLGQGEQIRRIRASLGMTQGEYAAQLGVCTGTLKKWEREKARVSKKVWEKYFA